MKNLGWIKRRKTEKFFSGKMVKFLQKKNMKKAEKKYRKKLAGGKTEIGKNGKFQLNINITKQLAYSL